MKRVSCSVVAVGLAVLIPAGAAIAAEREKSACENSSLSSVRFLDLIDALAWHGNLRDIWFTQALLGVTFELDSTVSTSTRYRARSLFGVPIQVILDVYPEVAATESSQLHGQMDFQELPGCLGLEESEIETHFHGAMLAPPPPPNAPAPSPSGTATADQSPVHFVMRDFRAMTGAYMRIADFHREAPTGRPVYRVQLIQIQVPSNAILPPFRWQIGSQPIQPLGNGYTINTPGQPPTVCTPVGNGFVCH
jgi:hypothetical protein